MHNPFDRIAKLLSDQISNTFGEDAVWLSGKGKKEKEKGKVLFSDPTEPVQIGNSESYEFRPTTATAEYYSGTFDGLKEAVDNAETNYISVRGKTYFVERITTKFDGNTFIAHLEPHKNK